MYGRKGTIPISNGKTLNSSNRATQPSNRETQPGSWQAKSGNRQALPKSSGYGQQPRSQPGGLQRGTDQRFDRSAPQPRSSQQQRKVDYPSRQANRPERNAVSSGQYRRDSRQAQVEPEVVRLPRLVERPAPNAGPPPQASVFKYLGGLDAETRGSIAERVMARNAFNPNRDYSRHGNLAKFSTVAAGGGHSPQKHGPQAWSPREDCYSSEENGGRSGRSISPTIYEDEVEEYYRQKRASESGSSQTNAISSQLDEDFPPLGTPPKPNPSYKKNSLVAKKKEQWERERKTLGMVPEEPLLVRPKSGRNSGQRSFLLGQNLPQDPEKVAEYKRRKAEIDRYQEELKAQMEEKAERDRAEKLRMAHEDRIHELEMERVRRHDLMEAERERRRSEEKANRFKAELSAQADEEKQRRMEAQAKLERQRQEEYERKLREIDQYSLDTGEPSAIEPRTGSRGSQRMESPKSSYQEPVQELNRGFGSGIGQRMQSPEANCSVSSPSRKSLSSREYYLAQIRELELKLAQSKQNSAESSARRQKLFNPMEQITRSSMQMGTEYQEPELDNLDHERHPDSSQGQGDSARMRSKSGRKKRTIWTDGHDLILDQEPEPEVRPQTAKIEAIVEAKLQPLPAQFATLLEAKLPKLIEAYMTKDSENLDPKGQMSKAQQRQISEPKKQVGEEQRKMENSFQNKQAPVTNQESTRTVPAKTRASTKTAEPPKLIPWKTEPPGNPAWTQPRSKYMTQSERDPNYAARLKRKEEIRIAAEARKAADREAEAQKLIARLEQKNKRILANEKAEARRKLAEQEREEQRLAEIRKRNSLLFPEHKSNLLAKQDSKISERAKSCEANQEEVQPSKNQALENLKLKAFQQEMALGIRERPSPSQTENLRGTLGNEPECQTKYEPVADEKKRVPFRFEPAKPEYKTKYEQLKVRSRPQSEPGLESEPDVELAKFSIDESQFEVTPESSKLAQARNYQPELVQESEQRCEAELWVDQPRCQSAPESPKLSQARNSQPDFVQDAEQRCESELSVDQSRCQAAPESPKLAKARYDQLEFVPESKKHCEARSIQTEPEVTYRAMEMIYPEAVETQEEYRYRRNQMETEQRKGTEQYERTPPGSWLHGLPDLTPFAKFVKEKGDMLKNVLDFDPEEDGDVDGLSKSDWFMLKHKLIIDEIMLPEPGESTEDFLERKKKAKHWGEVKVSPPEEVDREDEDYNEAEYEVDPAVWYAFEERPETAEPELEGRRCLIEYFTNCPDTSRKNDDSPRGILDAIYEIPESCAALGDLPGLKIKDHTIKPKEKLKTKRKKKEIYIEDHDRCQRLITEYNWEHAKEKAGLRTLRPVKF